MFALPDAAAAALAAASDSHTVFYTPKVVNSPAQVERDIELLRHRLRSLLWEQINREESAARDVLERREKERRDAVFEQDWLAEQAEHTRQATPFAQVAATYHQKRLDTPDPTSLIIIDEIDRLKMAALEQVRDVFDQGGVGMVLIGMPGMEKRLSRYPQLYSRVGFVHAFRPLSAGEVKGLLQQHWTPSGVVLPDAGLTEEEAVAAIIRITGGNFRLLHRLLTQIARLLDINALEKVTLQVVEAARESLVIGAVYWSSEQYKGYVK